MKWETTTDIYQGLANGSDKAWEHFVGFFRPLLVGSAARRRMGDPEEHADEVIEAAFHALTSGRHERGRAPVRRFIWGIDSRKELEERRRFASQRSTCRIGVDVPEPADTGFDPVLFGHALEQVRVCIDRVKAGLIRAKGSASTDVRVLDLKRAGGTVQSIAEHLGLSEHHVQNTWIKIWDLVSADYERSTGEPLPDLRRRNGR